MVGSRDVAGRIRQSHRRRRRGRRDELERPPQHRLAIRQIGQVAPTGPRPTSRISVSRCGDGCDEEGVFMAR
jgi:hypothetical protein